MDDITKITKEQFWKAYNNHPPSGWIKFAYKYFSKETEVKDMKLNRAIMWVLFSLFAIGFIGTITKLPRLIIGTVTIVYGII
jgi:hypothetical protein